MPTIRYAVVKSIEEWEYGNIKTIRVFSTKEAAEKYMGSILAISLHEMLQKGEVIDSSWDYEWTEESKKLFFQYLEKRNIFPKESFNESDVVEIKNLMIDMIKWKELKSERFIYNDNVEDWLKLNRYFVKPLKHF